MLDMGNYNLYLTKDKKFKTISLALRFRFPNKRETDIYMLMLEKILSATNNNYKSISEYNKARLEYFNPFITFYSYGYGYDRNFVLNARFISEKYTEKGMNEKTLKFILDALFNPHTDNNMFDNKTFEVVKEDVINQILKIKDNLFNYGFVKITELMSVNGYKELTLDEKVKCAKKITNKELYKYYKNILNNSSLDIFMIGDFDKEKISDFFKKNIKGNFIKKGKSKVKENTKFPSKINEVIEDNPSIQSKLTIGYRLEHLTSFERKYVSIIYNSILGESWSGKLMQEIREKNSMCYYIGSRRDLPYSVMYIYAGIDSENYEIVKKLINQEMRKIENGDFSEDDISRSKYIYHNALKEMEDFQGGLLDNIISNKLIGTDSLKTKHKNIDKVSKEDIIKYAKKIHIDSIFFLKGVKNEKTKVK